MAETLEAAPPVETSSPASDPLDAAMQAAYDAAMHQAASPPAPEEASPSTAPEAEAPPPAPAEDQASDALEDGEQGAPASDEPKPPSRREAARLREQLTQAETARKDLEQRLSQFQASYRAVQERYAAKLGTPDERQQLERIIANPDTDWQALEQARTRLAEMHRAQDELAPLYQAVEDTLLARFVAGLENLPKALPGLSEETHQAILQAQPLEALKLVHSAALKTAREEHQDQIEELQAQVSDLKTQLAARAKQPAAGSGTTPKPTGLAGLMRGGLPTDDAEQLALSGQLLGASLTS